MKNQGPSGEPCTCAARSAGLQGALGELTVGQAADVAIFDGRQRTGHAAVIKAVDFHRLAFKFRCGAFRLHPVFIFFDLAQLPVPEQRIIIDFKMTVQRNELPLLC